MNTQEKKQINVDKEPHKAIEKFEFLFPTPDAFSRATNAITFCIKHKFGLKRLKDQTEEEYLFHCYLKYQYCVETGLPLVFIGETYIIDGKVGLMVDGMMVLIRQALPEAEFEIVQLSKERVLGRVRRNANSKWLGPIEWTIEKARAVIQGFGKKALWKDDPEDMLVSRFYGSAAKAIGTFELAGRRSYESKEELLAQGVEFFEEEAANK